MKLNSTILLIHLLTSYF